MAKGLSVRHQKFVDGILSGLSAAEAYRRAGYSAETAEANAHRLMENDGVRAAIAEARRGAAQRAKVTLDEVVEEMRAIAFDSDVPVDTRARTLKDLCNHLGGFKHTVKHEGTVYLSLANPYAKPEGGEGG